MRAFSSLSMGDSASAVRFNLARRSSCERWRFGVKAERLPAEQAQLFEETVEADLAAMTEELEQLSGKPPAA